MVADKVMEAGGMVITKNRVDDLIMDAPKSGGLSPVKTKSG